MITESIEDPESVIAKGYPANVMPTTFSETLTPKEIEQLVEFLIESTGGETSPKGKKGGGSKSKGG